MSIDLLLKVNFQYNDGQQQKQLFMAALYPQSQMAAPLYCIHKLPRWQHSCKRRWWGLLSVRQCLALFHFLFEFPDKFGRLPKKIFTSSVRITLQRIALCIICLLCHRSLHRWKEAGQFVWRERKIFWYAVSITQTSSLPRHRNDAHSDDVSNMFCTTSIPWFTCWQPHVLSLLEVKETSGYSGYSTRYQFGMPFYFQWHINMI